MMTRIFVGLLLICAAESALALRCGHKLVTEGDYIEEVRFRCGDPLAIDTYTIFREQRSLYAGHHRLIKNKYSHFVNQTDSVAIIRGGHIEIFVEEWVYNFGPHRLMRRLHFENGILRDIESIRHGYLTNK